MPRRRIQITSHLLRLHVCRTIRFDLRPWSKRWLPSWCLRCRPLWIRHCDRLELLWTNTPWHRWNWQNKRQTWLDCWCSPRRSKTPIPRSCRWRCPLPWFWLLRCWSRCCSSRCSCCCRTWTYHLRRRWSLRIWLPVEQNDWNLRRWTLLRQWQMRWSWCSSQLLWRWSHWWSLLCWLRSSRHSRRC